MVSGMNKKRLLGLCAILVGLVLVVVGLRLLLEPNEYRATVKIMIRPQYPPGSPVPYQPYFLETELNIIRGGAVLSNVVKALNLNEEWGKRYPNGGAFSTEETVNLLRRRIVIDADGGTELIEISARDNGPDEAARIANAIVEAYKNYRMDLDRREMETGIEKLEKSYQEQGTNIVRMEADLKRLTEESNFTNSSLSDLVLKSRFPAYFQATRKLKEAKGIQKKLATVIEEDRANVQFPFTLVTIVAPAVPPTSADGPNRWFGAVCLICGLLIVACGFYSLLGR